MRYVRKTLLEEIIPTLEYTSFMLHRREILRVIDLEGKQAADLVAFNATDKAEKDSCVYSNLLNGTWKLTKGHSLYSNRARPMLSIIEEKVGLYYSNPFA
jgi:hypothetical protein